ncbi:MAG: hypothetical protein OXT67_09740 [Zetaproteobacteria bacterium]|nr:hypothetical protein [Zetaproteobacteria bacterium]
MFVVLRPFRLPCLLLLAVLGVISLPAHAGVAPSKPVPPPAPEYLPFMHYCSQPGHPPEIERTVRIMVYHFLFFGTGQFVNNNRARIDSPPLAGVYHLLKRRDYGPLLSSLHYPFSAELCQRTQNYLAAPQEEELLLEGEVFDCTKGGLGSLLPLAEFQQVRGLHLRIDPTLHSLDLSPLAHLKKLQALRLRVALQSEPLSVKIDLSPLLALPELRMLKLYGWEVDSLESLRGAALGALSIGHFSPQPRLGAIYSMPNLIGFWPNGWAADDRDYAHVANLKAQVKGIQAHIERNMRRLGLAYQCRHQTGEPNSFRLADDSYSHREGQPHVHEMSSCFGNYYWHLKLKHLPLPTLNYGPYWR